MKQDFNVVDCTTITRGTSKNTFGHQQHHDDNIQLTNETSLPLPPSPSLVAEMSTTTNNNSNNGAIIGRMSNVNSSNDGVTSFIEKTSKLLNVSILTSCF